MFLLTLRNGLRGSVLGLSLLNLLTDILFSSRLYHFVGQVINHVLSCLEVIDKQNFEKVETNNSLDVLYHKLFASSQANKDGSEVSIAFY